MCMFVVIRFMHVCSLVHYAYMLGDKEYAFGQIII